MYNNMGKMFEKSTLIYRNCDINSEVKKKRKKEKKTEKTTFSLHKMLYLLEIYYTINHRHQFSVISSNNL